MSEDEQALEELRRDIGCLDRLSKWTNRFNIFYVLKATRTEIRHSNVLAWLLDPSENHGLGDSVLQGFIQLAAEKFSDKDVFSDLLMELDSFTVQREWRHIDVVAKSKEHQYVLVIENKIDSAEHSNQCRRYREETIEPTYPGWKARYILLSPEGLESNSDPENWRPMNYEEVLDILESARAGKQLSEGAGLLIDNYIEIIRRDILKKDKELEEACAEIYAKHKRALDLIFENIPDKRSEIAAVFKRWTDYMKQRGELTPATEKLCDYRKWTRFTTPRMTKLLPQKADNSGAWKTSDRYFYEIECKDREKYVLQLSIYMPDAKDDYKEVIDALKDMTGKNLPKGYYKPFVRDLFDINEVLNINEELNENEVLKIINAKFAEAMLFEDKLAKKFPDRFQNG